MSIKVMTYVWEHSKHKGSELLTLLAIADFANDDGAHAYPSISSLAQKTRMTERNVQFVLKKLEESRELTVDRNKGPHGCHLFTIALEGVKSFRGEKQRKGGVKNPAKTSENFSPDPSLRDPEDNSLPSVESFAEHGTAPMLAPPSLTPEKPRKGRKKKSLACDDWLAMWLKGQDILDIPYAFLDDDKWWEAVSLVVTDGLNEAWLEREFAKMVLYFQTPGQLRPRTESGWKRFLTHWFQLADKIEQREKRQEKRYATQGQTRGR